MAIIKLTIRILLLIFIYLFNLKNIFLIILYLRKKDRILFNDGGFGHSVQDPTNYNYLYKNESKLIIYFVNNNFNLLINQCIKDINIIFIKTYINIYRYKLYEFKTEKYFKNSIKLLIKLIFGNEKVLFSYQELDDQFNYLNKEYKINEENLIDNDYKRNYLGLCLSHTINFSKFDRIFYIPDNLNKKLKKKISYNNIANKKLVMFYYRKKKQIDGLRIPEPRDGGKIENYFTAFKYLIDNNYKILFNGDVDYLYGNKSYNLIKKMFSNNILFNKDINLKIDEHYIFSLSISEFFIGNGGGGSYVHLYNNIPGLILDYFPYWTTVRNSVLYFKPPLYKNNKNNFEFLSKIQINNKNSHKLIRDMHENEILDSVINFEKNINKYKNITKTYEETKFYNCFPDWYFIKHDKNSILCPKFIEKHLSF